jgi:uncharacterized protein involved in exopolysaccharide biosynthesis
LEIARLQCRNIDSNSERDGGRIFKMCQKARSIIVVVVIVVVVVIFLYIFFVL